eukprot:608493-Prymnesium_polylepis.1
MHVCKRSCWRDGSDGHSTQRSCKHAHAPSCGHNCITVACHEGSALDLLVHGGIVLGAHQHALDDALNQRDPAADDPETH